MIPSIQLGLTGTITPIRSPPKNFKSLFDFAVAGPLAGFLVSVGFLLVGLQATASTDLMENVQLPSVPIQLLKSSALGGGLVELFLGNGVLDMPAQSALPLHPFAISGFVGMISNMLALLPVGSELFVLGIHASVYIYVYTYNMCRFLVWHDSLTHSFSLFPLSVSFHFIVLYC